MIGIVINSRGSYKCSPFDKTVKTPVIFLPSLKRSPEKSQLLPSFKVPYIVTANQSLFFFTLFLPI